MDDILIQIDKTNNKIEAILDKISPLSDKDVNNIQILYLDKSRLIESFVTEREEEKSQKKIQSSLDYWQKKFNKYLEHDKKVLEKLKSKVNVLADKIRQTQSNKKLLIYK